MEGGVLTIYSDVTQRSGTVILDIGIRRIEKSDQDRDGAGIHELLPVLIWTRMQFVGHGTGSDAITYLSVSCSARHQLHCVELAYPSSEQAA